jgi:hypothetical protein
VVILLIDLLLGIMLESVYKMLYPEGPRIV